MMRTVWQGMNWVSRDELDVPEKLVGYEVFSGCEES